ncbi:MAG: nickel-responsive transcriptional regulator NikR [Proteobacteria bacterium]|nr:nickel-responsive transcriptional regulator NikR [Pseudomonadota bacterium]NIS68628.1 nickel-responsive transcriptional regulator NikR [Pseudomonadota bacterium]
MSELVRFGISMDSRLLRSFDQMIAKKGYSSRSEAIRDLVRDRLVDASWKEEKKEVVGTITLVYNHEIRELNDRLIEIQHQFHDRIISSLHVHLDQHNCLEVLVVKGKGKDVTRIGERLIGVKGVKHGKLLTTTTGKELF